ncbi:MAG: hypothetical protein HY921_12620 [Elusimicrobia bacterium]|nr:hypothetical protein [Elusimicrobiota bacterium]
MSLLLALFLSGTPAAHAQVDGSTATHAAVWLKQGASLLYYDDAGTLSQEIGLGVLEDSSGSRINARETRGGASSLGHFAWTVERTATWNPQRTKKLESRAVLRFYGGKGLELWSEAEADIPDGGEPLLFSQDEETLLLSRRVQDKWFASVKNYLGNELMQAGPFPSLEMLALTPNGRYALARWSVLDKSSTHTFLDVARKARKDIPSGELSLGLARITNDGQVFSGKKMIFDFNAEPKP